ncbi:hypothetical protein, partial [Neisseria subflava]|uniref:hypothetical protein n=1 Tax=Neisseria subflava TaxID=28449 RepID=UPI00202A632A
VGNARVEPRANGILITKQASGSAKIDPLMAMFDAVSLLSLNPTARVHRFMKHAESECCEIGYGEREKSQKQKPPAC